MSGFVLTLLISCGGNHEVSSPTEKGEEPVGPPLTEVKSAADIVEAIANRNLPPKLVDHQPNGLENNPLAHFPESYDWDEEARVNQAIKQLHNDPTEEVWEEALRRLGDKRYCIIGLLGSTHGAYPITVGNVVRGYTRQCLIGVFERHMPTEERGPIRLDVIDQDLGRWREERKQKPLYKLQVEVGEKMVAELVKLRPQWGEKAVNARAKIEKEIDKLMKTGKPIFVKMDSPGYGYDRESATRVRKALRSGTTEPIPAVK